MSNMKNEFKIGIGIKELLGKTLEEQAAFLKFRFGSDVIIEDYEGKVEHISFNLKKWQFCSGILFYVFDSSENELYSTISLDQIQDIVSEIENKIIVKIGRKNMKIFSASWYNGADEPCVFFGEKWLKELDS